MIRLADRYSQARNIYISAICDYHPVFNEFHDTMENTKPFYTDAATYDAIDRILMSFPICTGTRINELAQ